MEILISCTSTLMSTCESRLIWTRRRRWQISIQNQKHGIFMSWNTSRYIQGCHYFTNCNETFYVQFTNRTVLEKKLPPVLELNINNSWTQSERGVSTAPVGSAMFNPQKHGCALWPFNHSWATFFLNTPLCVFVCFFCCLQASDWPTFPHRMVLVSSA